LLRLHWTEQDWLDSNGHGSEVPQKIKDRNWVGFLKDAFPISKLEEVQGSNPDKAFMRRNYLNQIYRVAEDEQMMRRRVGMSRRSSSTQSSRLTTIQALQTRKGPILLVLAGFLQALKLQVPRSQVTSQIVKTNQTRQQ
jgi:hypothetical protein